MCRPGSRIALLILACAWIVAAQADVLDDVEEGAGDVLARGVEAEEGVWRGPATSALLSSIGRDLFALRNRDFPYRLVILDDLQVNAYSLPGGHIYLLRGLLAHAANIDEVAAVVAHEMAHQQDADARRFAARELLWLGLAGLARHQRGDGAANLTTGVGVLNLLRHSRRQEAEADTRAVTFCLQMGYDPAGLSSFLSRTREKETGFLETLFATHPDAERRLAVVGERIDAAMAGQPFQAWHLCRSLAARGRPVTAYRLAHRLAAQPAHRWWADQEEASLRPAFDSAHGKTVVAPKQVSTEKDLRAPLDALRQDSRIRFALEAAQVLTPDPADARYLTTLGLALVAVQRLNRALQSGYEAWYRVCCQPDTAPPEARRRFLASVGHLRRGGLMISTVLGELTGMGPNRPLGALDGARTGLLWGEAKFALSEITAGQQGVDALLVAVTEVLARRNVAQLVHLSDVWPEVTAATVRAVGAPPGSDEAGADILSSWRSRLEEAAPGAGNTHSGAPAGRAADLEDLYVVSRLALVQLAGETRGLTAVAVAAHR